MGNQQSKATKEKLVTADQELRQKDVIIAKNEKDLQDKQRQLETTKESSESASKSLGSLQGSIESLNSQLASLRQERDRLQADYQDSKSAAVSQRLALERVSQSVTQERDRARAELRQIKDNIDGAQQHSKNLETELEATKKSLSAAVEERVSSEQGLRDELKDLQSRLTASEDKGSVLQSSLSTTIEELAQAKNLAESTISSMRDDLAEANQQLTMLQGSSTSAAQESDRNYSAIKEQLDDSNDKHNQLLATHDEFQTDTAEKLNAKQAELDETKKKLVNLQAAHDRLTLASERGSEVAKELGQSQDKVAALEEESEEMRHAYETALTQTRVTLDKLRVELASKISSHSKLFEERAALRLHLVESNEHAKALETKYALEGARKGKENADLLKRVVELESRLRDVLATPGEKPKNEVSEAFHEVTASA